MIDPRFVTIDELALWDEVWVWARGCWRAARVVKTARSSVTVAFSRRGARRLLQQTLPLERLRRVRPANGFRVVDVPAPTRAAIVTAMAFGDFR